MKNLSVAFLQTHGKQIYEKICRNIFLESKNSSLEYIENVFNVAFQDYLGIELTDYEKKKILIVHSKTIKIIQTYITSRIEY